MSGFTAKDFDWYEEMQDEDELDAGVCPDCGAGPDEECDIDCPSHDDDED